MSGGAIEDADGSAGTHAVADFCKLQQMAWEAAGMQDGRSDASAAYDQYREWLPFHHRRTVFLRRLSTALGYQGAA